MIICKGFDKRQTITSVDEWKRICPPAKGDKHWKEGRSAKELAKDWTSNKGKDLERLIGSYPEFNEITFEMAAPEYESKFDEYRGKGRQHDLLVLASDKRGQVLISVEAKADESFGRIIKDYYISQIVARINDISTKAPDRIEKLLKNVFDNNIDVKSFDLRYQLLHAIAGTIAEAKRRNIKRAVFLVYTYCSKDEKLFNSDKHKRNMKDLNQFVSYLSKNRINRISNDEIIGPFNIQNVDLYITKKEK